MAANTAPIFVLTPNTGINQAILTANTTLDLTAGTIYLLFTAGANGSWIDEIRMKSKGTNIATLIRFWLNNGATTGTATNNVFFEDFSTPATTASSTTTQPTFFLRGPRTLPASWRLYATVVTGVAAGFDVTTSGGDY